MTNIRDAKAAKKIQSEILKFMLMNTMSCEYIWFNEFAYSCCTCTCLQNQCSYTENTRLGSHKQPTASNAWIFYLHGFYACECEKRSKMCENHTECVRLGSSAIYKWHTAVHRQSMVLQHTLLFQLCMTIMLLSHIVYMSYLSSLYKRCIVVSWAMIASQLPRYCRRWSIHNRYWWCRNGVVT